MAERRNADRRSADRRSPLAGFAARFETASAGGALRLAEIPFLTQLNLRVDAKSPAAERIGRALGTTLPVEPGSAVRSGDLTVLWLGPDEWLVLGPDEGEAEIGAGGAGLRDRLVEAAGSADGHVSVVDVSAQRTTLVLAGARARDVLAHGCALDLHPRVFGPGRCAQTLLARAQVVLVARETDEFWVLCRSSFAGYVAEWLLDAAAEYVT
ncbi:sarcosine oxidase subunit gamma [Sphaerimonospora thailandensis]|uniref:Sarcosine oxidase subunit gamma n=1 Tax=Sphaerimonospora thailandensis TaxID=795644 RepID=A0A8J3VWK1_9ACTN|nr:sarcosine oxidase subunit gamma family protein [Sphaerimonospora thailandensis]GIH67879.1 sarcosine oxidase subunit gamma [Sphaerimonospora thailandensis]